MSNMRYVTAALTATLVVLLLLVLTKENGSLADPLIDVSFEITPGRNEKKIDNGTILPSIIDGHLEQGDYVITETVTVPEGAHLDIAEHTRIFANMDARILVRGKISGKHISFQSNELHSDYSIWHGIVIDRGGSVDFSDISIHNATAGLTCAGTGEIKQSAYGHNTVAIVLLPDSACIMKDIVIQHSSVGIHAININPSIENTTFISVLDEVRQHAE